MKVYVVYGIIDRDSQGCDYEILSVFRNADDAVDYAIKIAREAFDLYAVPAEHRFCEGKTEYHEFFVIDTNDYLVEVYVNEKELK